VRENGQQVDQVDGLLDELGFVGAADESNQEFKCEPGDVGRLHDGKYSVVVVPLEVEEGVESEDDHGNDDTGD